MKTVPRTRNERRAPPAIRAASFDAAYPLALRSAQVRSAAAVAIGSVPRADREDLEQDVLVRVWQALARYDPTRAGLRTFIELVVRTQFTSVRRSRPRCPELGSLDDQHLAAEDGFREIELRTDVRRVLAGVSVFDQSVALCLTECSAVETSRGMGVSRAAVYRAIGRLRVAFRAAGFAGCRRRSVACQRRGGRRTSNG
jgi:RNA polymerase sigma factor (sigma-70 family)